MFVVIITMCFVPNGKSYSGGTLHVFLSWANLFILYRIRMSLLFRFPAPQVFLPYHYLLFAAYSIKIIPFSLLALNDIQTNPFLSFFSKHLLFVHFVFQRNFSILLYGHKSEMLVTSCSLLY